MATVREFPEDYFPEDCLPPRGREPGTFWATSDEVRNKYDPLNQSPRITSNVITRVMTAAGFQDLNPHGNIPISSGRRGQRIWLIRGPRPSTDQVAAWYASRMPKLPGGKANPNYVAPPKMAEIRKPN